MRTKIASASVLAATVVCLMTLAQGSGLFAAADLRLLDAVQRRDRQAVGALLKEHVDVNAQRGDGLMREARVPVDEVRGGGGNVVGDVRNRVGWR